MSQSRVGPRLTCGEILGPDYTNDDPVDTDRLRYWVLTWPFHFIIKSS